MIMIGTAGHLAEFGVGARHFEARQNEGEMILFSCDG